MRGCEARLSGVCNLNRSERLNIFHALGIAWVAAVVNVPDIESEAQLSIDPVPSRCSLLGLCISHSGALHVKSTRPLRRHAGEMG